MEQWYSDAYFTRRQIHVIRKDVRFTLKGRRNNNRNYSLSNSHARIAFENFLTILTAITIHLITAVTSITLEYENGFQKKCVSTTYGHVWISHSMAYVVVLQRRLSNRKKRCLIDRFINRIGILRGVYVLNSMSFFKQLSE